MKFRNAIKKIGALVICLAVVVSGMTVLAAGGFDVYGNASFFKGDDGTYTFRTTGDGSIVSDMQIDITKGFEFDLKKLEAGWIEFSFAGNKSDLTGGLLERSLLLYDDGGKLCVQYYRPAFNYCPTVTLDVPTVGKHIIKMHHGDTNWNCFTVDGVGLGGNDAFDDNSVNAINNYNTETGEYEGAHFQILSQYGGTVITGIKQYEPPFKLYGSAAYNHSTETVTTSAEGAVVSNYRVDINKGIEFNLEQIPSGWINISFRADKASFDGGLRSYSVLLRNSNGNLSAQYYTSGYTGNTYDTGLPAIGKHRVSIAGSSAWAAIQVDGIQVGTEDAGSIAGSFNGMSNYNAETKKYEGGYFQILSEKGGLKMSGIKEHFEPFDVKGSATYTVNADSTCNFSTTGTGAIVSNYKVDVTKGIEFNLEQIPDGWINISFRADKASLDGGLPGGVSVLIFNEGGNLKAKYYTSWNYIGQPVDTGLSAIGKHRVSIAGGSEWAAFQIDGALVGTEDAGTIGGSFNGMTNYNAETEKYEGGYFQILSEKGGAVLSGLKEADVDVDIADSDGAISITNTTEAPNFTTAKCITVSAGEQIAVMQKNVMFNGANIDLTVGKKYLLSYCYYVADADSLGGGAHFGFGKAEKIADLDVNDVSVESAPVGKWIRATKVISGSYDLPHNYLTFVTIAAPNDSFKLYIADLKLSEIKEGYSAVAVNYANGDFDVIYGTPGKVANVTLSNAPEGSVALWFNDFNKLNKIDGVTADSFVFPTAGKVSNYLEYNAVIGDTNGDAIIDSVDLVFVRKLLLGAATLKADMVLDTNNDSQINLVDLVKIKKLAIA